MRRDHLDAVLAQLLIEWIAVVGPIADQILRLGLDHVEVEAQLYQPNFVVIGGMRADRERQSMTIHDCHDFHAFPALRRSDPRPATFAITNVASMKHSASSRAPLSRSSLATSI